MAQFVSDAISHLFALGKNSNSREYWLNQNENSHRTHGYSLHTYMAQGFDTIP
jgi:hypothetical protein